MPRQSARTRTSAYRIGLDLSGSSAVYYSGLFASRRQLELGLAELFANGQDATYLLSAWPLSLAVLEHHRGGELRARVPLAPHLRAQLSDGRHIELELAEDRDSLKIDGDGDEELVERVIDEVASERLRLRVTIDWTEIELGKEGPPLGSRVTSLRLANGFEHPRGWIGGDDAWELRSQLEPDDDEDNDEEDEDEPPPRSRVRANPTWSTSVLLVSLTELPFAELLPGFAELPPSVRKQTFYFAQAPAGVVALPKEPEQRKNNELASFAWRRVLEEWLAFALPNIVEKSWAHRSSRAQIRAAFERAGWTVLELDSLAPDRRSTSAAQMIATLQAELEAGRLDPAERAWVHYLAHGGATPRVEWTARLLARVALGVGQPIPKRLRARMTTFAFQGDDP
jgi:hypothetical protein